jgi:hypothetical protein
MIEGVDEIATRTVLGIVHYSGSKRRDVYSVLCCAAIETVLLAFLNNMVAIFESEVNEIGNYGYNYGSGITHYISLPFLNFTKI